MEWKRKSEEEIRSRVFAAIQDNVNYHNESIIGLPGTFLDPKVFSNEVNFVKTAPFLSTLVQNPNHIGCHTLGESESYFKGTQELEREVIAICAETILKAEANTIDGYVAPGGTEANLQAIWIYRNYFMHQFNARLEEIAIVCSEDSHYSMKKGGNIFQLHVESIPVDYHTRKVEITSCVEQFESLNNQGIKYLIIVNNMMTTMFGSVDDLTIYVDALAQFDFIYKIHVDAAYGGFYYPLITEENTLNFQNPLIDSFTLDAHKLLQAPYGTGIFLIRKNWMQYAQTDEASYVIGTDTTICGSRSGANAVAIWMILSMYGKYGWYEKITILRKRTTWLCNQLKARKIEHFREDLSNIVTMPAEQLNSGLAHKFGLVPDNHERPMWYKIVVMEHVTVEKLELFLEQLDEMLVSG
jgi:glutamate/tyrosine decarboxylase-like PLP-dependent enzyme